MLPIECGEKKISALPECGEKYSQLELQIDTVKKMLLFRKTLFAEIY